MHVGFEHVERDRAAAEHHVVERADVEPVAQLVRRFAAQLLDLQFADLVRQRLARVADVAVDFIDDVEFGLCRVRLEVIDRLLPRPVLVMQAGVDDEPHGAPHLVGQLAELVVGILVEPHLFAEALAVEAPAFDERGGLEVAAELRQLAEFLRQRNLQVMARHRFVNRQHRDLVFRAFLGFVEVHVVVPRALAVHRRALVVGRRGVRCDLLGDLPHAVRHARQLAEVLRQLRVDALCHRLVGLEQFFRVGVAEFRVRAQVGQELVEAALEVRLRNDFHHFTADARDFLEADLVDLVRCQVGRRVEASEFGITGLAVRRVPQADGIASPRQVLVDDVLLQLRVRRHDRLRDRIACGGLQARLLGSRDRVRHLPERFVERALVGSATICLSSCGGTRCMMIFGGTWPRCTPSRIKAMFWSTSLSIVPMRLSHCS